METENRRKNINCHHFALKQVVLFLWWKYNFVDFAAAVRRMDTYMCLCWGRGNFFQTQIPCDMRGHEKW
jgi:hypothetical protein